MWTAPCSCATGMKRMPAAGKMSSASMYAEPTMPKMSVTPCAIIVSTSASEGVIFTLPRTTSRLPWVMSFMYRSPYPNVRSRLAEHYPSEGALAIGGSDVRNEYVALVKYFHYAGGHGDPAR